MNDEYDSIDFPKKFLWDELGLGTWYPETRSDGQR